MTAVADAKTVIETLIGRTATNDELQRIAAAFVAARNDSLRVPAISNVDLNFADPDNPTAEEKAALFLSMLKWFGKELVKASAESEVRKTNYAAAIQAARDAAEADWT